MQANFDPFKTGKAIMRRICPSNPAIAEAYGTVALFLFQNPDMQSARSGKNEEITSQYLEKYAQGFISGRHSNGPAIPKTIPDERIRDILEIAYSVPPGKLDEAIQYHMEAMGAETFIGWVLESYIAHNAEQLGWAWCSGAMVRSVDFIKPENGGWRMLQIKNRSNSENSSSSRVRLGTLIEMWFRVYASNGRTNWDAFPDTELRSKLTEIGFRDYIISWIRHNFQHQQ